MPTTIFDWYGKNRSCQKDCLLLMQIINSYRFPVLKAFKETIDFSIFRDVDLTELDGIPINEKRRRETEAMLLQGKNKRQKHSIWSFVCVVFKRMNTKNYNQIVNFSKIFSLVQHIIFKVIIVDHQAKIFNYHPIRISIKC